MLLMNLGMMEALQFRSKHNNNQQMMHLKIKIRILIFLYNNCGVRLLTIVIGAFLRYSNNLKLNATQRRKLNKNKEKQNLLRHHPNNQVQTHHFYNKHHKLNSLKSTKKKIFHIQINSNLIFKSTHHTKLSELFAGWEHLL